MNNNPDKKRFLNSDFNEDNNIKNIRSNNNVSRPATSGATPRRRPLNEEERRRLEAARQAMLNANLREDQDVERKANYSAKISDYDEEKRRKKLEEEYLFGEKAVKPKLHPSQRNIELKNPHPAETKTVYRKFRLNVGTVVFILIIAAVIGLSINKIAKNVSDNENKNVVKNIDDDTSFVISDTDSNSSSTAPISDPIDDRELVLYDAVSVNNSTEDEGKLILVNYDHEYKKADSVETVNVYENRTGTLKVSTTLIELEKDTFAALEAMCADMVKETGCSDLMIVSGYRTKKDQEDIYASYLSSKGEKYTKSYVADPGFSEHHTGLACDLSTYTSDGKSVPISESDYGYFVNENCSDYGFVLRYPADKADITKIAHETWHFRYVGLDHAKAMEKLNMCQEEYIEMLKSYTFETKVLGVSMNGDEVLLSDVQLSDIPTDFEGSLIYFVPLSDGDTTETKIPRGEKYSDYEISGTNAGGFVVTIHM